MNPTFKVVDFGEEAYIIGDSEGFMVIFGYILACWIASGLVLNAFRFFIYFRSPTHLYESYMFDKRTRNNMIAIFKYNPNCPDKAGMYFRVSLVLGMVLPLIPLLQAIVEIKTFSKGYVSHKPNRDEE